MPYKDPKQTLLCKARYRAKHRDELRRKGREYASTHREQMNATRILWRELNHDKWLEQERAYCKANPDVRRDIARRHYLKHGEKRRAHHREWLKANPEKGRITAHARRIRLQGNGGTYTIDEWDALKARYNYTCLCCNKTEPDIKLTVDHVIPIILGGTGDIDNIQPLCKSCNCSKHTKSTDFRPLYIS